MGQIVKRKKKGRPSKADLAHRSRDSPAKFEPVIRRSLRRRNVRYNIDFDDYLDEVDEDEEEHENRRLKKLKLVVKLNQDGERADSPAPGRVRMGSRGSHAQEYGASASEDDIPERKPLKKMIIGRCEEEGEDEDDDDKTRVDEDEDYDFVEERGRTRNVASKGSDSVPGTPSDTQNAMPLPDKRTLELILDKLQKKDIYGVYAEPVDPEELPDYHEVIEHPMDFTTVRKKLASGAYSTMEEFESDVFVICSNAMQYNAPETIYYKQANIIQELAKKKFGRLRITFESSEKDLKLEQDTKSNFSVKQSKRPLCRTSQEPIGSDFSSGATLATTTGIQNLSSAIQCSGYERTGNTDGHVEGNSSPFDANLEKKEEQLSAKGFSSRLGRKAVPLDENRRSTYNISDEPVDESDSILSTFEGETRQLVAVGLHAEYSYARSLARFAATLGPVAWKVASKTIKRALPDGCKFGRGWVGEYEPLATPVLMILNFNPKESGLFPNLQSSIESRKDEKSSCPPTTVHPTSNSPLELGPSLFGPSKGDTPDGKPSFFGSGGKRSNNTVKSISQQQQNLPSKNFSNSERVKNQVELNLLPSPNHSTDAIVEKHFPQNLNTSASRSKDVAPVNVNLAQSASFRLPASNGAFTGKLPNGKVTKNCSDNQMASPSSDNVPNHIARGVASYSHGQQVRGLSDPVQLIRILAEKAKNQQQSTNQPPIEAPQVISSAPSVRRDPNTAAAEAARAWMSIGAVGYRKVSENSITPKNNISADSLYNPAREFHSQITKGQLGSPRATGNQFHPEKNGFPSQAYAPHPQIRPVVFPHFAPADLSKFQLQPHWRALSPHTHIRQKQDMLPPDLNISFQSPGSPARQSSGVLVDSQQPDLALQL